MNLAKYVVALEAQTAQYVAELQKANTQLKKFHDDQKSSLDKIYDGFKRLAEAVAVVEFAHFVKDQIDATAETAKLAERLGITVQALSELQFAAKASDVPVESLTTSMQFMARNLEAVINKAGKQSGGAAAALSDLGLSAKELLAQPIDKAFTEIVDKLGELPNRTQALADAMQIFGRGGAVILQMSGNVQKLRDEAVRLGVTIDDVMVARAEAAHQSMLILGAQVEAAGRQMAIAFGPAITGLIEQLGIRFGNLQTFFDKAVGLIVRGVGLIEDAFYGWQLLIAQIEIEWAKLASVAEELFTTGRLAGGITGAWARAKDLTDEMQKHLEVLAAAGLPSEQLVQHYEAAKVEAVETAKAMERQAAAAKSIASTTELKDKVPPFMLSKPGSFGSEPFGKGTGAGQFGIDAGSPEGVKAALSKMELEAQVTKDLQKNYAARAKAQTQSYLEMFKRDQEYAQKRMGIAASVTGALSDLLTALVARHDGANKTMLKLQRAVALADIGINTARAVMQAFANLPPPASYIAAGVAIAEGAAQATNVMTASDSFAAGTSTTVGVIPLSSEAIGNAAGSAAAAASGGKSAVQIIFQGDVFGWDDTMRSRIVDSLRDVIDNKDVVIIGRNSRQGMLLAGGG